jgi:purine-binding chemotaxis protein CheW
MSVVGRSASASILEFQIAMSQSEPIRNESHIQEVLLFTAGGQLFALPLRSIQEVRMYEKTTPMPMANPAYQGVLNLRGTIVPVLDLNLLLGKPAFVPSSQSVIVIVNFENKTYGLAVDAVNAVRGFDTEDVHSAITAAGREVSQYVDGLLVADAQPIQLLKFSALIERIHPEMTGASNSNTFQQAA